MRKIIQYLISKLSSTHLKVNSFLMSYLQIDHEYECPFCFANVQIILNETLLVGDSGQIDYTRLTERPTSKLP